MSKEKLVELLNGDLAKEYQASVQYVQHSGVITGAAYGDVKKEILAVEQEHAMDLSQALGR